MMDAVLATEETIVRMDQELREIRQLLEAIHIHVVANSQDIKDARAIIEKVSGEVMPTVNALSESPMLKMFLPKKAK